MKISKITYYKVKMKNTLLVLYLRVNAEKPINRVSQTILT